MAILSEILDKNKNISPNIDIPSSAGSGVSGFHSGLTNEADPQTFIFNAAVILIWGLGVAAVITFIYAGFKYITAGGESEQVESAKKMLIGSIIGIILVIGSLVIFNTMVSVLKGPPTGGDIRTRIETGNDPTTF